MYNDVNDVYDDEMVLAHENVTFSMPTSIPVRPMMRHRDVRGPEDDWTGITSKVAQRRIQNRLHQRSYRRRHPKPNSAINPTTSRLNSGPKNDRQLTQQAMTDRAITASGDFSRLVPILANVTGPLPGRLCDLDLTEAQNIVNNYEKCAYELSIQGSPNVDNLLTLIKFNVFRALVNNTSAMGFTMEWLNDDAESPFTCISHQGLDISHSPPMLRPTLLQRTVPHHPWIDLLPSPTLRDNILRAGVDFDDAELCFDLVEFCNLVGGSEGRGLIVWGCDPSDPYSWEVSEGFASKWGWVIRDCSELFLSTNYWREIRGEKKLLFV
ncbi:hypothetical protein V1508DRAFT_406799 [Lipomyces doorenjongii]|uniref:uncharacterized protein n=1 Tax=Lipomyces doorenjongii TaxID=383834 RepID=UPI0034CEA7D6